MADQKKKIAPPASLAPKRCDIEVRERLKTFVKTHYANTLGKDIELLDQPGGLELLHQKYCGGNK